MSEESLHGFDREEALELIDSSKARFNYLLRITIKGVLFGVVIGLVLFFADWKFFHWMTFHGLRELSVCVIFWGLFVGLLAFVPSQERIEKLLGVDRDAKILNEMRNEQS